MKNFLLGLLVMAVITATGLYIKSVLHPAPHFDAPTPAPFEVGVQIGPVAVGAKVPGDAFEKVRIFLTGLFQVEPRSSSNTVLVVQGNRDVTNFSFVEDTQYTQKWLLNERIFSTKKIFAWAEFCSQIGIDLTEPEFKVQIDGNLVRIHYPMPKVLSTEATDLGMWSDDGLINGWTDNDRVEVLRQLQSDATALSGQQESLSHAAARFEDTMRGLINKIDPNLNVSFESPISVAATKK